MWISMSMWKGMWIVNVLWWICGCECFLVNLLFEWWTWLTPHGVNILWWIWMWILNVTDHCPFIMVNMNDNVNMNENELSTNINIFGQYEYKCEYECEYKISMWILMIHGKHECYVHFNVNVNQNMNLNVNVLWWLWV